MAREPIQIADEFLNDLIDQEFDIDEFYAIIRKLENDPELENVKPLIHPRNMRVSLGIRADYRGEKRYEENDSGAEALSKDLGARTDIEFFESRRESGSGQGALPPHFSLYIYIQGQDLEVGIYTE